MEVNLKDEFINQLAMLRQMAQDYRLKIVEVAKTNPMDAIPLQEELESVAELIASTKDELITLRKEILTNSRRLLEMDKTNPLYPEKDAKLRNLGFGGRRKTRKNRKSRR